MFPIHSMLQPISFPGRSLDSPIVVFQDYESGGSATATGPMFSSTADAAVWLTTLSTSAIPLILDNSAYKALLPYGPGSIFKIINAGTNDQGVSMQMNGENWVVTRKKRIIFETRICTSAIAGTLLCVGLANTDTTLLPNGGATLGTTDFIGFTVRGTSGLILPIVKGAGTADSATGETLVSILSGVTAPALVNNTWSVLRFEVVPVNDTDHMVYFYVDGILVAKHSSTTAALPLDASQSTPIGLTASLGCKTQGSTANNIFVDYFLIAQER